MTNFENLRSMTVEQLAEWLDKHGQFDGSPWITWFDEEYCKKCDPVMCKYEDGEREFPCAWCELNDGCKYFPDMQDAPDNKEIIKLWLEIEVSE
jgi:hypothetical protein